LPAAIGDLSCKSRITKLDFSSNNLRGAMPTQIGQLTALTTLYMNGNAFTAQLPSEISLLGFLKAMYISNNEFTGTLPNVFTALTQLSVLDLSNNFFKSSLPELWSCTKLTTLDIANNLISGSLSENVSKLIFLKKLNMPSNSLSGPFPQGITSMTRLSILNAYMNSFTGTLSAGISDLQLISNLDLTGNMLVGTIPAAVRTMPGLFLIPQGGCPVERYTRQGQDKTTNLGVCVPPAQPFFVQFAARASIEFAVEKKTIDMPGEARLVVLAFNAAGINGIGNAWWRNGLGANSTVSCGSPLHCVFPAACRTMWVQMADCTGVQFSLVGSGSEFSESSASLLLAVRATGLAERDYPLQMFLPVTDNVTWQFLNLSGSLSVKTVADATRSDLASLCQASACLGGTPYHREFLSANGAQAPLLIKVRAADLDGFQITRAGETIAIVLAHLFVSSMHRTLQAVYDDASKLYSAAISGLTVAGVYLVSVQTRLGTASKANFTLVCDVGFQAGENGECLEQRTPCQNALTVPSSPKITAPLAMTLSNLGHAATVELLPLKNTTAFPATGGNATVIFDRPGNFLIRVTTVDGQQCTIVDPRVVSCGLGYQEVNGVCRQVRSDDVCGHFAVMKEGVRVSTGQPQTFVLGDKLQLLYNASQLGIDVSSFRFELIPTQGKVVGNIMQQETQVALERTGPYRLLVTSDTVTVECPLISELVVQPPDCGTENWLDKASGKCKRLPQMAVRAAAKKLRLTVPKLSESFHTTDGILEVHPRSNLFAALQTFFPHMHA
jgi:hypothetical protein